MTFYDLVLTFVYKKIYEHLNWVLNRRPFSYKADVLTPMLCNHSYIKSIIQAIHRKQCQKMSLLNVVPIYIFGVSYHHGIVPCT